MPIAFDLNKQHHVVVANSHYYKKPTEPMYIDRTLQYHNFIYLVDGNWMITENDQDYLLKKDDVLLLSANHYHYTRLPCAAETKTMCIHVTCSDGDCEYIEKAILLPILQHTRQVPDIKSVFSDIVSLYKSNICHKDERMTTLVHLLILKLNDLSKSSIVTNEGLTEQIIQLINKSPTNKKYTVKEVADRLFVSTKTIEYTMKKNLGMTFAKYQANRKLEMVARQLEIEPGLRLSEIAMNFGFYDEFHLSKAFKAKYGMPPSVYRHLFLTKTEK